MNYIETNCAVAFEGQSFESGGAIVTDDYLVAYPDDDDSGWLRDWHGKIIGKYRVTSSWPVRSWIGKRMYSMRAIVDGKEYVLRGFGKGMIARGRAVKTKK